MDLSHRKNGVIALEVMSIVIAILLGFAVSTWDSIRRDRARGRDAVVRLSLELRANQEAVSDLAPYYLEIAQAMDSVLRVDGDGPFNPQDIPRWNGIQPPTLRTAAFTVATSTGALEHVDFATADLIASAYEGLDYLSGTVDSGMEWRGRGELPTLGRLVRENVDACGRLDALKGRAPAARCEPHDEEPGPVVQVVWVAGGGEVPVPERPRVQEGACNLAGEFHSERRGSGGGAQPE